MKRNIVFLFGIFVSTFCVAQNPTANFTAPNVCFNNPTVFTDLSTGNNTISQWSWNFGDSNISSAPNPSHTYLAPGTYTVTLTVTNNFGNKDTLKKSVWVNPLPLANFVGAGVCFGDTTCFSDLSSVSSGSNVSWSWNFGDPNSGAANISASQNPCHLFTAWGTFSVNMTVTSDSGCQSNATIPATINSSPTAAFTGTAPCLGGTTSLMDGSIGMPGDPITSWSWNMSGGSPVSATTQNASTVYGTAGTHTVTLVITSQQGCKDTIMQQVLVYNIPIVNFAGPDSGCAPVCNQYVDASTSTDGTLVNWAWSFPGGSPSSSNAQNPPTICYNSPGSYTVSLTVTSSYGFATTLMNKMVDVYSWPNANFTYTISGDTISITNTSAGATSYNWNFGDGITSTLQNPQHVYTFGGNYFLCLNVANIHGCWDSICQNITILGMEENSLSHAITISPSVSSAGIFNLSILNPQINLQDMEVYDPVGNKIFESKNF